MDEKAHDALTRYFTAADGTVYRVLDSAFVNGKRRIADPPAPWAKQRFFNPQVGKHSWYQFRMDEDREPTDEALERQFSKASHGWRTGRPLGERRKP